MQTTISAHQARCALTELKFSGEQPLEYLDVLETCLRFIENAERTQDPASIRDACRRLDIALATAHQARFVFSNAAARAFEIIERRAVWAERSYLWQELQ